jgi:hypothetical protein
MARVADEQHGAAALANLPDPAHALAHKVGIAGRERLVDDENIRVDARRGRKGQARLHAARVGAKRLVDHRRQLAEVDDPVQLGVDLLAGHAQHHAAGVDVLASGQQWVEPGAKLENRRHLAVDVHATRGRIERPGQDLE